MSRRDQIPGQLVLPFGDDSQDSGRDLAESSASLLPSGGDSVIRWRQVE